MGGGGGGGAGSPRGIWTVTPPPLGTIGGGLSLKPASIAPPIAPTIACPEICAMNGVVETGIACSLMLSVGTPTLCINAAEVDAALVPSPLYCAVIEWLPTVSEEVARVA